MRHLSWFRWLSIGVLAGPIAAQAQGSRPQIPPATVRELATIEGDIRGFQRLPNSRAVIYSIGDSTWSYNIASKRATLLGRDIGSG